MLFTRKVNIIFGISDALPLQRIREYLTFNIVQAINWQLAVQPIVEDKYSYMISEIDSKLLKVMKVLGFGNTSNRKVHRLPDIGDRSCMFQQRGIMGFFSKYGELCKAA